MLNRKHDSLTFDEFLETKFEPNATGAECIYSLVMMAAYSRLYFMYQSHPLSIIGMAIFFTRHTQLLWTAFRTIVSAQMCEFIQLLIIQMTLLNVTFLIHLEDTYRNEFKTAHAHILARAFLDQCLDICQHDIRKPLESLLQRQKELMHVAEHAGYVRAIKLSPHFLSKLEPLHVSGALLAEISQELTFIRHNMLTVTTPTTVVTPVDHMKSHYSLNSKQLHRSVANLISSLSSVNNSGANVKIYAEIDNKLSVVRVDWKNLSMILTNLVSAALRNIREFCLESPRHKDIVNYVKIKMVAIESDVKVPFVHPRLMLVNVCDSSNAAAKSAALARDRSQTALNRRSSAASAAAFANSVTALSEERDHLRSQYGRSVCEQLVRTLTPEPVFQTIAVQSVLQTVQRFTFQYHLTPQTRRTQDYIQTETDLPYLTVQPTFKQYYEDYERIMFPPLNTDTTGEEKTANKKVVYFTSILVAQRHDIMRLTTQFDEAGWSCMVKYILNIPSMHSIAGADCVIIDHQLEAQEGVNVCDTVLKLRVCGFNGVIAVVLQQNLRDLDLIRDELDKSAANVDLIITGHIKELHIKTLTAALEKQTVKHLLFMNGN
uniref:Uncharacterized protein n=1 Tax=Spumella elongata TaxID=89044 RepID=A0A7S3HPU6_9STRA